MRCAIESTPTPGLPCFLVGHSMGGLIAANYLLERQDRFAGAAFSGAAFEVPEAPGAVAIFINRLIAALLPRLGVLQLDASEVSRDPQVVQALPRGPPGAQRQDHGASGGGAVRRHGESGAARGELTCRCWSCTARPM
jgi:alpha-beta hydrolase superfamily lysophospholipase